MLGYRADLAPERALQSTPFRYANAKPPPAVDWREKGAVTPVKNQEQVMFLINCICFIASDLPTRLLVTLAVVGCCRCLPSGIPAPARSASLSCLAIPSGLVTATMLHTLPAHL